MSVEESENFKTKRDVMNRKRKDDAVLRKQVFLRAVEDRGTIYGACVATDTPRGTYNRWRAEDLAFGRELEESRGIAAEQVEQVFIDSIKYPEKYKDLKPLSPIAYLNANMAWKYKPQVAMNEDTAKEVIHELRKISRDAVKDEGKVKKEEALSPGVEHTISEILENRGKNDDDV